VIDGLPILDCHQHFYDSRLLHYDVFAKPSAGLTALVGDYAALPHIYRPEDYARDIAGLTVDGTVWAEFISSNPLEEVVGRDARTRSGPAEQSDRANGFCRPGGGSPSGRLSDNRPCPMRPAARGLASDATSASFYVATGPDG